VSTKPSAFIRPRRVASFASVGALVGFSLLAASPASATSALDCTAANTVDSHAATMNSAADIQHLLDLGTATICLVGSFSVPTVLIPITDATFYGDPSATLTGNDTDRLIDSNRPLTVENLTFTGGHGLNYGGAIYGDKTVTAINSTFEDNTAGLYGGAIFGYDLVDAESSTFIDNHGSAGGAISDSGDGVTARNSTFSDNTSTGSAGAILSFGPLVVDGSTFNKNTAVAGGAAVQSIDDAATITNSTFARNTSSATGEFGGAALIRGGTVTQSTFLDKTIPDAGGGQAISSSDDPLTLLGNIFASSSPTKPQVDVNAGGSLVDAGGNVFSTAKSVETALTPAASSKFGASVASLFVSTALGDHGGPTKTLAIGADSPARGAVPSGSLTVDQRGKHRPARSDAGAFEFIPPVPVLAATGTDPSWLVLVAAALVAAGGLAFGAGRRQLRRRTSRS
jgi:predicted outer membrane repeat protein